MKTIKVTQTKSSSHRLKNHKLCLQGLGLRRIGHTVEVQTRLLTVVWSTKSTIWLV